MLYTVLSHLPIHLYYNTYTFLIHKKKRKKKAEEKLSMHQMQNLYDILEHLTIHDIFFPISFNRHRTFYSVPTNVPL